MLKMFKELAEMKSKMGSDSAISKQYAPAVKVTLLKTIVYGVIIMYINSLKEGADIERNVYITKMAQARAEEAILKAELSKEEL
jgi:KaiC/GvpD/RAD55 family RecA-like ATPase